jgi:protein-tyrosine phosphatase
MPEVIDWRQCADRSAIRRAAQALVDGRLVVFPTETVYGIAASTDSAGGVERLLLSKGRADNKPFPLAVRSAGAALEWIPRLGTLGQRLAKRCWPGPLTIVSSEGVNEGRAQQLPAAVRQKVCPNGSIGLRVPAHDAILGVMEELPGPLVLTSANRSGEADAVTSEEALQAIGDEVELVIADGPCRYGRPSTVVRVEGATWEILREGILLRSALQRLSACTIVFVCTGNTCRSPLAEALFKKLLADRLGCNAEELPARGFVIRSAGLSAACGGYAAPEAVEVARELGADLNGHTSRPVTSELVAHADYLLVMTRGHLSALTERYPKPGCRPRMLAPDGEDIPDPLGADHETYQECARQIQACIQQLLPEVEPK